MATDQRTSKGSGRSDELGRFRIHVGKFHVRTR